MMAEFDCLEPRCCVDIKGICGTRTALLKLRMSVNNKRKKKKSETGAFVKKKKST